MSKLEMNNILYMDTSSVLPNKLFLNMLYGKFAMPVKNNFGFVRIDIYL